ncbi:glycosyltransferase family 4 protein [Corynebacterium sanguinis]|uniref:glycosyltransferase family 4 protein n=1 Tax=Corynebacterium sanguinis TaxID=2594913 RepID=UPI0021A8AF0B|nr:glycosyltransferase family 1 protein [Corynebacterium sanguinis]MCT1463700.1 glycosyltransferase family 4 protein [Corynebacterium sanguinis]MCT2329692.1 glycosyltransferase family 4 protein [Corynebacterium sanguinis]
MGNQNHIVYGALALRPGGSGVQTYQRELLRGIARLADETYTLSATVQKDSVGELPERIAPIAVPVSGGMKRALLGLRPVKEASIFHSLDVDLPFAQCGVLVSTVHDMSVFDTPWAMSAVRARGEQALLRRSLKTADELIAVSEFTAERIHALTGRSAHVVPLAPASWARVPSDDEVEKVRSKYGLPDRFAFQLGTVEPRKRPDIAANAAELIGIPMVLAGADSDNPDLGFPALGLGYVDREDIPALYRAASVVCYASVYEGFGLPPVEAMACGAVVVASDVGGIRAAVGEGALLVGALDVNEWADAMRGVVFDEGAQKQLRAAARDRCAQLGWENVTRSTLEVYQSVL